MDTGSKTRKKSVQQIPTLLSAATTKINVLAASSQNSVFG